MGGGGGEFRFFLYTFLKAIHCKCSCFNGAVLGANVLVSKAHLRREKLCLYRCLFCDLYALYISNVWLTCGSAPMQGRLCHRVPGFKT